MADEIEATEQGVSRNPRDEMMETLYKQADESHAQEDESHVTLDFDADDNNSAELDGLPDTEGEEASTEPSVEPEPDAEMATIKVDGEERQVLLSDIVDAGRRTLQKESAADKRLAEANEILRNAREQAKQPVDEDNGGLPETQGDHTDDDFGKRFVEKFYDGEEGEAADMINDLVNRVGQRQAIPAEPSQELVQAAVEAIESKQAMNQFASDERYSAINNDEALFSRWDSETALLINEHPDWPLLQVAQEAGDRINRLSGIVDEQQPSAIDAKRSAASHTVPTTASSVAVEPEAPRHKTPAEIVAEIKKSRGQ